MIKTTSSEGYLLARLTACFYILFTLLPDSHSLMVAWPWVFLWQIALICPVIWLLWQIWHQQTFPTLGNALDWCMGLVIIGLIISTIFAQFPHQAIWYSWAVLCFMSALYALNNWLRTPQRRYSALLLQGYVNLAFIVLSLGLWITQTLLPELSRLQSLKQYGLQLPFDFSVLELRNWAPLGHQNYVAGYLLLALPLLAALTILQWSKSWHGWLWLAGLCLGVVDLYTTSSRGGWLGLAVLCIFAVATLLLRSSISPVWIALTAVGTVVILSVFILTNNRLYSLIIALLSGKGGGELAYRLINNTIGWRMGIGHPWSGVGLGGVPMLYQQYRPFWAGRESQLTYQLHGTPTQLWAELGLWGILPAVGLTILLIYLLGFRQRIITDSQDRILLGSLGGGLLAYGAMSLTDFQLDNICISGTLVLFLAAIAAMFRGSVQPSLPTSFPAAKKIALAGSGMLLAVIIWLIPVHRAWQLSSQGFLALRLQEPDVSYFTKALTQAHQLAPWEPYYPYQLGWNFGNSALQTNNTQQQQQLLAESITWFQKGIEVSPYSQFGQGNLAWLLLNRDPKAATQAFLRSAQLVPAKGGIFFGLGLSLLRQGQADLGIEAIALEGLRDPLFIITSPVWNTPVLQPIYPTVLERMKAKYNQLIEEDNSNQAYWYRCRGGLSWWRGDLTLARLDLETYGSPLSKLLLELAEGKAVEGKLSGISAGTKLVISAWFDSTNRLELLRQAWLKTSQEPLPAEIEQDLIAGMESSTSFQQWLREKAPVRRYRQERAGFGVNSRHIDGFPTIDFWTVVENTAMVEWFAQLLPSPKYNKELELVLQQQRDTLLDSL